MHAGFSELLFIFLLALVVVGPKRLPGLARQMGKYVAEFKRASNDFKRQFEAEMLNIEMEERAKEQRDEPQTGPKILPPEPTAPAPKPVEGTILPAQGTVSRGSSDAISEPLAAPAAEPASATGADV